MNIERQKRIDRIFAHALDLTGEARDQFIIDQVDDDDMKQEIVNLLRAATSDRLDARIDTARERIWSEVVAGDDAEEDLTGQHAGHWRIAERIARGGLATVYKAYRSDGEFEQKVAFKVLRRGLDTDDVVARFRAERQILSTLDHPSIAQILDGGALPDGRPYLVLEYVDGEPITAHCDKFNTDTRGKVVLTLDILSALHHAHRHTLVHRDIKPSNILVSADGNVTVLDFGIAKLLDPEALPGTSTLTRTGISLLTPGYGSPEQHAGEPVTTTSDIYQVGLVLYELLAGIRPVFIGAGKMLIEPEVPSRQIKDTLVYGQVHGDLDAIVMKAMHPDPGQRYASATEMVADLERYLDGKPVEAHPDTIAYRLHKLTKRRPWLLPITALVVLGLASYIVTLTLYSRQLQLEQQRAEAAQEFMVDLLSSPDPFAPADPERGLNITVVEALELGRRRLENELTGQPELRATLLSAVAGVYQSLDQNEASIELGEDALSLNIDMYGEQSEAVLENLRLLADGFNAVGNYDRARDYYTRQLNIAKSTYMKNDPLLGLAEVAAGTFEKAQGNLELGLALMESGIRSLQTTPVEHPRELVSAIVNSTEQDGTNDADASLRLLEDALPIAESTFGADSLYTAQVRIAIGRNALFAHDFEKSEANYQYGLNILEAQLGREHSSTITALQDYGVAMNVSGDYIGAERVFRELVDRLVVVYGEDHRSVGDNYQNLATTLTRQERYGESLPLHRKAYEVYKDVLEPDHYIIAFPLLSISFADLELGNAADAEVASKEALQRLQATLPDSYVEGVARCLVGISLEQQGNVDEGTAMVESSHALIMQRDVLVPTYQKLCRVPDKQP